MKIFANLFLSLFALCLCSCSTASITKTNGDTLKYSDFMTNRNVLTAVNDTSDTNINPIPLIGGKVNGTDSLTPTEGEQKWAMTIGGEDGIRIGLQDQGTPMGTGGKWLYKMERAFLVYKGITETVAGYFGNKNAGIKADVAKSTAKTNAGVTKHISDNRLQGVESLGLKGEVGIEALKSP